MAVKRIWCYETCSTAPLELKRTSRLYSPTTKWKVNTLWKVRGNPNKKSITLPAGRKYKAIGSQPAGSRPDRGRILTAFRPGFGRVPAATARALYILNSQWLCIRSRTGPRISLYISEKWTFCLTSNSSLHCIRITEKLAQEKGTKRTRSISGRLPEPKARLGEGGRIQAEFDERALPTANPYDLNRLTPFNAAAARGRLCFHPESQGGFPSPPAREVAVSTDTVPRAGPTKRRNGNG